MTKENAWRSPGEDSGRDEDKIGKKKCGKKEKGRRRQRRKEKEEHPNYSKGSPPNKKNGQDNEGDMMMMMDPEHYAEVDKAIAEEEMRTGIGDAEQTLALDQADEAQREEQKACEEQLEAEGKEENARSETK